MHRTKRYIVSIFLVLLAINLPAQDITGTWEGDLGNDQFLQLNVIQNGDKICGYTWDHVNNNQRSYCKAYFEGRYDKKSNKLFLKGTSFIENSGGHLLMRLSLKNQFIEGKNVLEGFANVKSVLLTLLSSGGVPEYVYLKKVSGSPQQIIEKMEDCFLEKKKSKKIIATPPVTTKPKDSIAQIIAPVIPTKDSLTIPKQLIKRKNTEQSHLEVNVKNITLNVYDNAIVDGDTVSIFYNGKMLLSHQRLSEKPIVINLELDEKQTRHEIILFAENLGSIPPNTALIVITAGDKRYELFASSSLEENAVLVFDYRPK